MAACGPGSSRTIAQGIEAMQERKDDEEQHGKPDAVRGQWLGQGRKQHAHKMNLLYEALWLVHPLAIVPQEMAMGQDNYVAKCLAERSSVRVARGAIVEQ